MEKKRIGVNGLGRVGRGVVRLLLNQNNLELVAINSRSKTEDLAFLLQYDSVYGRFLQKIEVTDDQLFVNGKTIQVFHEDEPSKIPWEKAQVDYVVEASGKFKNKEDAQKHLGKTVKRLLITAPAKDEDVTIVMGVNEKVYDPQKHFIISNASCTTNCLAPVVKVLNDTFGVNKGIMTTIHAYTSDQVLHDKTHKDLRRARAAALSMIPTSTGASKAVGKVLPELAGKLLGMAIRVPTPTVSLVDLVVEVNKTVSSEAVNDAFKAAAQKELKGILAYEDQPLVSIDYAGSPFSSTVDGLSTLVLDQNWVKVIAWYDNEFGYNSRVVDLLKYMGEKEI